MNLKYLPYESDFLTDIKDIKSLLIIVAMESEEVALLNGQNYTEEQLGDKIPLNIKKINLQNCEVLIAQSGVGLVSAGVLLSRILESYDVIQLGVGGALDEKLSIGDVVIATSIVQHDSVASHEDGSLFIAPGELTLSIPPDQQIEPMMRTDKLLRSWILEVISSNRKNKIFNGVILSGSEFAASVARKKFLKSLNNEALLVEMEAAALAQLCRKTRTSFVSVKTVADRAVPGQSISDDYKKFLNEAVLNSRMVLDAILNTFS